MAAQKKPRFNYAEVLEAGSLEPVSEVRGDTLVLLAVFIGRTRLIDNLRVRI